MNIEAKYTVELSSVEFINILTSDYKRIANERYMLWHAAYDFFDDQSEQASIDRFSKLIDEVICGPQNKHGASYMSILQIEPRAIDKDNAMSEYKRIVRKYYSLDQKTQIIIAGFLNISHDG